MAKERIVDGRAVDEDGYFVPNKIIVYLREHTKRGFATDLDTIWALYEKGMFTLDEMKEFYRLLGYEVSGYEELFEGR